MRDPRLAELECLLRLEREGPVRMTVPHGSDVTMFGLSSAPLRAMLLDLIEEGIVNSNASAAEMIADERMSENLGSLQRMVDLNLVRLGREVTFRLAHKGLVRLHRLRDELEDGSREPFGILYSRRTWDTAFPTALLFASEGEPLSVLFLDLDHFKRVNSARGHDGGDAVLRGFFEIVRSLDGERVYRYGGEEVAALLPKTDLAAARGIAEAIRVQVETTFKDRVPPSTVSIGATSYVTPVAPEIAFRVFNRLMLAAKESGRNCVKAAPYGDEEP
jgi:diguanylate cyclase (GGDEF)-like protein